MEGPHGLQISRDGKWLHMTTGHGSPDGKYWQYALGPDTLAGPGILLGNFPASLDVTPDGLYAFVVNFNLHGDMVPSSVSVVYTPDQHRGGAHHHLHHAARQPHRPDRALQYSGCMMDDQLVEIDTRTLRGVAAVLAGQGQGRPASTRRRGVATHQQPSPTHAAGQPMHGATACR